VIRSPGTWAAAAFLRLAVSASFAAAADGASGETRPTPIPEPMIAESITNIEGSEAGEVEFDLETLLLRRGPGATASGLGVEAEWRATRRLGLAAEAAVGRSGSREPVLGQLRTGLAWSLLHDFGRDLHVQAEATARFGGGGEVRAEGPLELPHLYSAGLRAALCSGPVTLRMGVGAAFGDGASPFVQSAVLRSFGGSAVRGFAGLELNANVGAGPPLAIVPQVFVTVTVFGAPVDVGVGVPWSPALRSGEPSSIGGVLRVVVEP
jgi:hypothetical protein